ncbi:S1 RNA-binding domain-containing protein [Spiroplasma endosymbiont of Anurida maritima]|uniref:S1 RNA-binding domain-containing protein n=1 Tax=Spiroplasma endosymbiont of Anurida maritima TaxID=2967972 RepID=UPI0036D2BCB4
MYEKGQVVNVSITSIAPYGAFCTFKGGTGLIHISEFSDYFVKNIEEYVAVGDEIDVEILSFDENRKQAKLSFKNIRKELLKSNSEIQETGDGFKNLKDKVEEFTK